MKLNVPPSELVQVALSVSSGDPDIFIQIGDVLEFLPSNWDEYQVVELAAGEDPDCNDGQAIITIEVIGDPTIPNHTIVANEGDNEEVITIVPSDVTATDNLCDRIELIWNWSGSGQSGFKILRDDSLVHTDADTTTILPSFVSSYDTEDRASEVFVRGHFAYVADKASGLQIIDISNPSNPTLSGTSTTQWAALGIVVDGDYAYIADGEAGLQVIDISDPYNPTVVSSCNSPGTAMAVFVLDSLAYMADGASGLQIISIANRQAPSIIGSYDTPGTAYGIYVSYPFAYIADRYEGLQIINVMNPNDPSLIGMYDTSNRAYDVSVSDNYAFVADGSAGLQIIDVSDPSSPTLIGACDTPNTAYGLFVSHDKAYIADGSAGLQIIDITNPVLPILVASYDTPDVASDVLVSGKYAYIADRDSGLQIIQVQHSWIDFNAGFQNRHVYSVNAFNVCGDGPVSRSDGGISLEGIDISYPQDGDTVVIGAPYTIMWNTQSCLSSIRIELSREGPDGTWEEICSNARNNGTRKWTVSGPQSDNCYLRILNPILLNIVDMSNAPFVISDYATGATSKGEEFPTQYIIYASYPNPFNAATTLHYGLPKGSLVSIKIYDITGTLVRSLLEPTWREAGQHRELWDAQNDRGESVTSGLYFCRLEVGGKVLTKKMILLK